MNATETVDEVIKSETITRKNGETVTIELAKLSAKVSGCQFVTRTTYGGRGFSRTQSAAIAKFLDTVRYFKNN